MLLVEAPEIVKYVPGGHSEHTLAPVPSIKDEFKIYIHL
jgi:hypothetical protein